MYDLWMGYTCQLLVPTPPAAPTGLMGVSRSDPIQAARLLPGYGSGDTVEDQILVLIEDQDIDLSDPAAASIASVLGVFDGWFTLARAYTQTGLGEPVVLHLEPVAGEVWESPIRDGWVETAQPQSGPASNPTEDRLSGSLALTLHVMRTNYWEQPEVQLYTVSADGADGLSGALVTNQVTLDSHGTPVLANRFSITLDPASGSQLPTPCHLELESLTAHPKGTLYLAQRAGSQPAGQSFMLDDAAGSGGTPVSDAAAGGGSYKACTWAGSEAASLLTWSLPRTFCQDAGGAFFTFLLRQGCDLAESDLQLKVQIKLHANGEVVGETSWGTAMSGRRLQEIPSLRLPPFRLRHASAAATLDLGLLARSAAAGSHSLGVDGLQLLPCDGWRRYEALSPLQEGWKLVEDGPRGTLSTLDGSGSELLTHVPVGDGFWLYPGKVNSFYLAWMDAAGVCIQDDQVRVKAWCRARRRIV